jgi:hypothetical protein
MAVRSCQAAPLVGEADLLYRYFEPGHGVGRQALRGALERRIEPERTERPHPGHLPVELLRRVAAPRAGGRKVGSACKSASHHVA